MTIADSPDRADVALADRLARVIWLVSGSDQTRSRRLARRVNWRTLTRDPSGRSLRGSLVGSCGSDGADAVLADEYALLPETDRAVLEQLVVQRVSREVAAKSTGLTPDEVTSIAGHALRRLHLTYQAALR